LWSELVPCHVDSVPRPSATAALLVTAAVALAGLGSPGVGTHPDEALYLALGAEMHARNTWLTPTQDGSADFTKPPLLYWAMRLSFALFGVRLWSARLPVALAALGLAWMAGQLARSIVGERAAPLAVLMTGTSLGLLRYGRLDMMDVPLALAIAVGLWTAWTVAGGAPTPRLRLVGVAGAAAALLKGPVGPVLLILVGGWWFLRHRPAVFASPWLWASLGLGLALAAPWYLAMAQVHGAPFLNRFFGVEIVGKFRLPWTAAGELLLLLALPVLFLPWTPLLSFRRAPRADEPWSDEMSDTSVSSGLDTGPGDRGGFALVVPWVLAVLVVYSLPGLKHPHYMVPALVPLVVPATRGATGSGRWLSAAVLGALGLAGALAMRFPFEPAVRVALAGATLLAFGAAVLIAAARPLAGALAVAGTAVVLLGGVLPAAVPGPVPPQVWALAGNRGIFTTDQNPGLLTLLAGRTVRRAYGATGLRAALAGGGVLVLSESDREQLPEDIRRRLVPLQSWSRLRSHLPVHSVLDAWLRADLRPVSEIAMLAVSAP
jgi:4-amino-4-deoxy-L-arabinose transferase-like glycosyltransferase